MAVYVDNAAIPAQVRNGSVAHDDQWSHLTADTPRELHDFATGQLGLRRAYFQDHWPFPHYDLTSGKRAQALALGATDVSSHEAAQAGRWLPPLLLTSSRDGVTPEDVEGALKPLYDPRKVLVAGGARGGDTIGARLWSSWGGETDVHRVSPDAWRRSRGAGCERNAKMVKKVAKRSGECVALVAPCADMRCRRSDPHGSHGASHCAGLAYAAGLQVHTPSVAGQPSAWQPPADPARHDWQKTADPNREECPCGVTAVRGRREDGRGWSVAFAVPGLQPTPEPPPHFGIDDRGHEWQRTADPNREEYPRGVGAARTRADKGGWSAQFTEPRLPPDKEAPPHFDFRPPQATPPAVPAHQDESAQAPRPAEAGPVQGTTYWRGVRYEIVGCGCWETFSRPAGENYAQCLSCNLRDKAASAGAGDREGVERIQAWNAGVIATHGGAAAAAGPQISPQQADREAGS